MQQSRLVLGLAAVFAGMTTLMVALAAAFRTVVPLVMALAFGTATYFFWYHATGRGRDGFRDRIRRESVAREQGRATGGFGAGPREQWTPPGGEERWEAFEQRQRRRSRQRRRGRRNARSGTGGPLGEQRPTPTEARKVLGVGADADESEVKRAYREKVKETHPDTPDGDEEAFKRVTDAYERLTD